MRGPSPHRSVRRLRALLQRRTRTAARDERGAVAVVAGLLVVVLVITAAIAVDLGMQRVARRDMQSLADVVALDLARELNGRDVATLTPLMPGLATASRNRNTETIGDVPTLRVELGSMSATGVFTRMTAGVPTSVRVIASTSVDFAFGVADSGDATRAAVSSAQQGSCLMVGSYLARVDTSQSALLNTVLGGLLGTAVNLAVVDYNGIATSDLTLAELIDVGGLGVGTPDQLLNARVTSRDFFLASAKVLDAQGKTTEAKVLRTLAASASTPAFRIGDLIAAAPGGAADPSALAARFNVLRLVQGAAFLSNKGRAVAVPGLSANLGVGTTSASLTVIEAPAVACGPVGTVASTAQVRLNLTTRINAATVAVPGLGTSVTVDAFDVTTSLDLGKALATLSGVTCTATGVSDIRVALTSAVVGGVSVSASPHVTARVDVGAGSGLLATVLRTLGLTSLLQLLSPPKIDVDTRLVVSAGSSSSTFTKNLVLPLPASYTTPVGSGTGALIGSVSSSVNGSATTVKITSQPLLGPAKITPVASTDTLFGQVLDPILSQVTSSLVNPLVTSLQNNLVAPLASVLGLQYGGADVWAIPTPSCASPRLVG